MNLNQIRILEACHANFKWSFRFKDELQNDSLCLPIPREKYYVCNLSRVQEFIIYRFQIKNMII